MKILLVRHGQADSNNIDAERKLTPQGRSDIQKIGKLLPGSSWNITRIFSSPLVRASETAQILSQIYSDKTKRNVPPEQKNDLSPGNPINNIDSLLEGMGPSDAAVWVFHMPDLAELASRFTGLKPSSFYVTPGTVIALNVPVKTYINNSMMVFMMQPEQLAELV